MAKSTQDKPTVQAYTEKLIQMTSGFCEKYLDEEYKELCEKLIRKMSRKRVVPFLSGKIEIWAAGVVYALGGINFLFDKNSKPHATPDDICNYFGTSKKIQRVRRLKLFAICLSSTTLILSFRRRRYWTKARSLMCF
jgi:hypothetical protein